MEKVIVEVNKVALTKALILWNTGVDGEDGGTCNITAELPWKTEWEKFMTWTEANELFIDKAIGGRDMSIVPENFIEDNFTRFLDKAQWEIVFINNSLRVITNWAHNRAEQIMDAYYKAIAELNKRIEASKVVYGMIEKVVGVDSRGFVKYEKVFLIEDHGVSNVIDRLWHLAKGLVPSHEWEYRDFNLALSNHTSLFIGDNYHCHLGNKLTNS